MSAGRRSRSIEPDSVTVPSMALALTVGKSLVASCRFLVSAESSDMVTGSAAGMVSLVVVVFSVTVAAGTSFFLQEVSCRVAMQSATQNSDLMLQFFMMLLLIYALYLKYFLRQ